MTAVLAATISMGLGAEAEARGPGDRSSHSKSKQVKADAGPIVAVVSLARQRIWVYGRQGLIGQSAVSTGISGHRTPTGIFSVIQKNRFHRSNIYSNAPMPYMQRITWSGVALHAGVVPGYPASHGCIRLPNAFAAELWRLTRIGARVVVVPDEVSIADVEPARLPTPVLGEVGGTPSGTDASMTETADQQGLATVADNAGAPPQRLLNPSERALVARARAAAEAAARAKGSRRAIMMTALKAREANRALAAAQTADRVAAAARAKWDAAALRLDQATTPEAAEQAGAALAAAESAVQAASQSAAEAQAMRDAKFSERRAAADAVLAAKQASQQAAAALKAAERAAQPVSILVSRKASRIYVRQAWAPVHEAAIVLKEPDKPLGTHLYVAMAPREDGKTLHWLSASAPLVLANAEAQESADSALQRFEMPPDTRRFIEERLWAGASLIVSDEGISSETGATTDFIVLSRWTVGKPSGSGAR